MISGCHRDEKVVLLIGSTGTWTVYNGIYLVAFSVSLGIGVVSGNESDLSQDGKIMDEYNISTGFWITEMLDIIALVLIFDQQWETSGMKAHKFSLSLSCQNLFVGCWIFF